MIDYSAAEEEMDREINSWGYTMNATDYMSGLRNLHSTANFASSGIGMGRGRGAVDISRKRLDEIRLAARINRLEAHNNPMGHLPTTEETLAKDVGPEIVAGLRSIGILSSDDQLNKKTTSRNVPHCREDVRIDRNVPLILNGDVFRAHAHANDGFDGELPPQPKVVFDPSKPLEEQFSTIEEFRTQPEPEIVEEEVKTPKQKKTNAGAKKGKKQKWTKVPLCDFLSPPGHSDRNGGRPPLPVNSMYEGRALYGIEGKRIL
ncbi:uncharacterized protein LOC128715131 [Anopheles marshallii]|uniref:uncharacterized protein LOC128715131 n=1 Tax=Anopheles marshallii TaxID=1521116 RepID=UPI00237B3FEB|nr:uncharacterized protein LOC128715131 [Anopheles marshallii]